jgi:hypothetical protein
MKSIKTYEGFFDFLKRKSESLYSCMFSKSKGLLPMKSIIPFSISTLAVVILPSFTRLIFLIKVFVVIISKKRRKQNNNGNKAKND